MTYDPLDDLRRDISQGHVLVVVGTGVSLAATGGKPDESVASWRGLLKDGVARCQTVRGLPPKRANLILEEIQSDHLEDILSAAGKIWTALGTPDTGELKRWLKETVGSLRDQIQDRSVLEAIWDLDLPLLTTNYDDLLKKEDGIPAVTWKDGDRVVRVIQRREPGIVHLHGHWSDPESIILDARAYDKIRNHGHAQAVLRGLRTFHTLLFIGCGEGLSDPNFGALLEWAREVFQDSEGRHYRLCLEREKDDLLKLHKGDHIIPIPYGSDFSELGGFIREELGQGGAGASKTNVPAAVPPSSPRVRAPHLPPCPHCFGREDEVRELVETLLQAIPSPTPILGGPGAGKTTVTLAALYEPPVAARYGARRFFVRCDGAKDREALVGEIARTIGITPGPDLEASLFEALSGSPAVLVLDNAETPWDGPDKAAVSELLADLGSIEGVALVASIRGSERPWGPNWRRSIQVGPLELPAARAAFLDKADHERFAADPDLDPLLEDVERLALAVVLLGHHAQGVATLAELRQEWQVQRTALLRRDGGQHRLENIEVSLELSIAGSRMTPDARRLLSVLALLPDGIDRGNLDVLLPGEGGPAAMVLRKVGLAFDQGTLFRALAPVREYVRRQYPPGEEDRNRVIEHYLALAREGDRVGKEGGAEAAASLVGELGNVEAMIHLGLEKTDPEPAIRAAFDLGWFTAGTGWGTSAMLLRAVEAARRVDSGTLEAQSLWRLGDIALYRSDHATARQRYEEALPLFRSVGSVLGEANCIQRLGDIALYRSDYDTARQRYEEALPLYRRVGDVQGEANCIHNLGDMALYRSDHDTARQRYEEALPLYRGVGDVQGEANCIQGLGDIALERSDHDTARQRYEEALPLYRRAGSVLGEANCIQSLGDIALERSDHDTARAQFVTAFDLYKRIQEPYSIGGAHRRLARLGSEASDERRDHLRAAREAWESIKRPDLVEELREEFGEIP